MALFHKKEKVPAVHQKINWRKEATLLPGYIIIFIWLIFTAAFLIWILAASFSTTPEILQGNVFKFETGIHFENYATAWSQQNVARYFGNSLLYSIAGCLFTILISAPASYVLSRYKFVCNKIIKNSLIIAMSVPAVMIVLPIYAITASWRNAPDRLIFTVLMIFFRVPYTTVFLLNFFQTLSRSYEEAAAIDGCSPAGIPSGTACAGDGDDLQLPRNLERVLHGTHLRIQPEDRSGRCRIAADSQLNEVHRSVWCSLRSCHHRVPAHLPALHLPV